jgi:hypothetical protein
VYGERRAVTNSGVLLFDTVSVHWATKHGDFNTVVVERVVPTAKDTAATATAASADLAAVDTVEAADENDQVALPADAGDSDCDSTAAAAAVAEPSAVKSVIE